VKAAARQRWALSFADLALLLLGFFVLLQARPDTNHLSAGLRAAFGGERHATMTARATDWFEPGEAILQPAARRQIERAAAGFTGTLTVSSRGTEAAAARFDGWELAAARTAAVARALSSQGIAPARIAIAIDPATGGGQTIEVTRH
jgi:flagellar motor protein MotB